MSDSLLAVRDLGKRFKHYQRARHRVYEWLPLFGRRYHDSTWALRGVSFDVAKGEVLGVMGRNGAGKSTLLRLITGALNPTEGTVLRRCRKVSSMAIGAGLNPYLTGRENVIVGSEALCFPRGYAAERMNDISDFAELGAAFDRPVLHYSTGMRTRLGFSLFAFLESDLMIFDEVLAGGDAPFREKCLERFADLARGDTTIIVVSHALSVLQAFCDRVLLLDAGRKIWEGAPAEAGKQFQALSGPGGPGRSGPSASGAKP